MRQNGQKNADMFADGTLLDDLVDSEKRTVSVRVFCDREIFERELTHLFARAWIPVAHISEIREHGDFLTRHIGRDPVIVTRDYHDEIHVMLNVCSHRGSTVCRGEAGNARTHTCPFHGWIFGAEGKLMGVPFEKLIYGDRLDRRSLRLRQARVGVLAGIVFATWDESAPELDHFIGEYKWYLDAMLSRTDGGLEVVGPPQRSIYGANWKLPIALGDNYHVPSVHQSLVHIGAAPGGDTALHGFKASVDGHVVSGPDFERFGLSGDPADLLSKMPPAGMTPELVPEMERHLTHEQMSYLATTPPSTANIFPSASILMFGAERGGDTPIGQAVNLRFFVPLSPDRTEFLSFYLVERDAPQELKNQVAQTSAAAFGVGGFIDEDDIEIHRGLQRGFEGVITRQAANCYRSVGEPLDPDPGRPGIAYRGVSTDDTQWLFYQRYFEFLEGRPW